MSGTKTRPMTSSADKRVLRVAVLGAESTGKSTLCAALAEYYDTLWVPEYLREFVEVRQRTPEEHEQIHIATTQLAREKIALENATPSGKNFLFCDTTPLMTAIYSRFYWGRIEHSLAELARSTVYDHTVVTAPDGVWVADGLLRESPAVQQTIHDMLLARLAEMEIPYLLVAGDHEQRVQQVQQYLPGTGVTVPYEKS